MGLRFKYQSCYRSRVELKVVNEVVVCGVLCRRVRKLQMGWTWRSLGWAAQKSLGPRREPRIGLVCSGATLAFFKSPPLSFPQWPVTTSNPTQAYSSAICSMEKGLALTLDGSQVLHSRAVNNFRITAHLPALCRPMVPGEVYMGLKLWTSNTPIRIFNQFQEPSSHDALRMD
jgi:hypothetical protein